MEIFISGLKFSNAGWSGYAYGIKRTGVRECPL